MKQKKKELFKALTLIDATENMENLKCVFTECMSRYAKWKKVLSVAYEERSTFLTTGQTFILEEGPEEKRIRKMWLAVLLLNIGYMIFSLSGTYSLLEEAGSDPDFARGLLIFSIILGLIGSWISYHCAYKKRGTKLLLFYLLTPLSFLSTLLDPVYYEAMFASLLSNPFSLALSLVSYAFSWFANLKLRIVNLRNKPKRRFLELKALMPARPT